LAVKTATAAQDSYGQPIQTWSTTITVWGAIEPLSGRELLQAQQIHAETTHRIITRYRASITAQARIVAKSRTFEVVAILNKREVNEYVELLCKEIAT